MRAHFWAPARNAACEVEPHPVSDAFTRASSAHDFIRGPYEAEEGSSPHGMLSSGGLRACLVARSIDPDGIKHIRV